MTRFTFFGIPIISLALTLALFPTLVISRNFSSDVECKKFRCICSGVCKEGFVGCKIDHHCENELRCIVDDGKGTCELETSYWWVLGAGLSILGSATSMVGTNLQKYAFMMEATKHRHDQVKHWANPIWLAGLFLVILGSLGDFSALYLAAQSIVAPIGAATLVFNVFFAHVWLKEKLSCKRDIVGTVCIISGSTLAVIFGDHTEALYTVEDLRSFYFEWPFLVYATIVIISVIGLYIISKSGEPIKLELNDAFRDYDELHAPPIEGDNVRALKLNDNKFYPGNINKEHEDGTYDIIFENDNGVREKCPSQDIQVIMNYVTIQHKVAESGISVLKNPEYPGNPTSKINFPKIEIRYFDRKEIKYKDHNIKFYRIEGGWIHNYNEKNPNTPTIQEKPFEEIRQDRIKRVREKELQYKKWEKIHPFSYCALSGIFGGQNILFGKMVAELLGQTFTGENQLTKPLTYIFVLCMLASIFTQLHFLAVALSFFDALYVVPVFQCFFIVVSTLAGAAYFKEFSRFKIANMIGFPIGILLTLTGVVVLSSRDMAETLDGDNGKNGRYRRETDGKDEGEFTIPNSGLDIDRQASINVYPPDIPSMERRITLSSVHRQPVKRSARQSKRNSTSNSCSVSRRGEPSSGSDNYVIRQRSKSSLGGRRPSLIVGSIGFMMPELEPGI